MSKQYIASHVMWDQTSCQGDAERRIRARTIPGYMTIDEVMAWMRSKTRVGDLIITEDESEEEQQ